MDVPQLDMRTAQRAPSGDRYAADSARAWAFAAYMR